MKTPPNLSIIFLANVAFSILHLIPCNEWLIDNKTVDWPYNMPSLPWTRPEIIHPFSTTNNTLPDKKLIFSRKKLQFSLGTHGIAFVKEFWQSCQTHFN